MIVRWPFLHSKLVMVAARYSLCGIRLGRCREALISEVFATRMDCPLREPEQ